MIITSSLPATKTQALDLEKQLITSKTLFKIGGNQELANYLSQNQFDPWINTSFEGYVNLGSKKQGAFGERFISSVLKNLCSLNVQKPLNSGHDRLVSKIKTEFKFTLASRDCEKHKINVDGFSINHVALLKDWERLIICAINPEEFNSYFVYITKQDFIDEMKLADPVFKSQQGGNPSNNDDYFIKSIKGCREFFNRPYIKQLTAW